QRRRITAEIGVIGALDGAEQQQIVPVDHEHAAGEHGEPDDQRTNDDAPQPVRWRRCERQRCRSLCRWWWLGGQRRSRARQDGGCVGGWAVVSGVLSRAGASVITSPP